MDLIVFIDEVQGSIAREESRDNFSVLYQLNSDAFAYCAVWLAAFDANFLEDYSSALWGSLKCVCFVVEAQHAAFVGGIVPSESLVPAFRLASSQ